LPPQEKIIDDVGREPHERQVATTLPDDLVPGGHRDEVGEPLERDRVAVVNHLSDSVGQGGDGSASLHDPVRSYTARTYALRTGSTRERDETAEEIWGG
jgi:hypothetical protein